MSGIQSDIEMGDNQNAKDVEMQSSDQASEQRKSSSSTHNFCSTSTDYGDSFRQGSWVDRFMRKFPGLFAGYNFLQLITRYTNNEIIDWVSHHSNGLPTSSSAFSNLKSRVILVFSEQVVGGELALKTVLEIACKHHRVYQAGHRRHPRVRIGAMSIPQNLDAWYAAIDKMLPSEFTGLSFGSFYKQTLEQVRDEVLFFSEIKASRPLSAVLNELLSDPLFPFRDLAEIPRGPLLELCTSHSYGHIVDKLKVNNPQSQVTRTDVSTHARSFLDKKELRSYLSRQKQEGHAFEHKLDCKRAFDMVERDLFPRLYTVLGSSTTTLCLPTLPKNDESELHALLGLCRIPKGLPQLERLQLAASQSGFVHVQRADTTTALSNQHEMESVDSVPHESGDEDEFDEATLACIDRVCKLDDQNHARNGAKGFC